MRREDLVEVAVDADQAALLAGRRADRIAFRLAENLLVGGGEGASREDDPQQEGETAQAALSFLIGRTLSAETIWEISWVMKRAVIGVPS